MGLGGIVSSFLGAKGAKKAASAANAGMADARDALNASYTDIQNMYEPYLTPAQQGYQNYINTINGNMSAFNVSPWGQAYNDYIMNNTINRLQGTAAAKGSLQSGNTLKELQTNIQSILNNDYLNRLNTYLGYMGGVGDTGLNITGQMGNYRNNLGSNIANTYMENGQINAANQVAKYKNLGNAWSSLADAGASLFGLGNLF